MAPERTDEPREDASEAGRWRRAVPIGVTAVVVVGALLLGMRLGARSPRLASEQRAAEANGQPATQDPGTSPEDEASIAESPGDHASDLTGRWTSPQQFVGRLDEDPGLYLDILVEETGSFEGLYDDYFCKPRGPQERECTRGNRPKLASGRLVDSGRGSVLLAGLGEAPLTAQVVGESMTVRLEGAIAPAADACRTATLRLQSRASDAAGDEAPSPTTALPCTIRERETQPLPAWFDAPLPPGARPVDVSVTEYGSLIVVELLGTYDTAIDFYTARFGAPTFVDASLESYVRDRVWAFNDPRGDATISVGEKPLILPGRRHAEVEAVFRTPAG